MEKQPLALLASVPALTPRGPVCPPGGDGRPGGEQVPEHGAAPLHLRPLSGRVGPAGPVGRQAPGLLRQHPLAHPGATPLLSELSFRPGGPHWVYDSRTQAVHIHELSEVKGCELQRESGKAKRHLGSALFRLVLFVTDCPLSPSLSSPQ